MILVWLVTGVGAVAGSIVGNAAGRTGLFVGATVGGLAASALAAALAGKAGWIPQPERRGALFGAMLGFLIAAPLAVANLHTPVTPVLLTSLAGAGALLGAGISRGRNRA
jgi:hypothetical protein